MNPFKGNTLKYLWDAPAYQVEMYEKHGPISFIKLGSKNIYIMNHPEAVQKVLLTHAKHFQKGMALQNVKKMLGENILSSDGQAHITRRKTLSKIFSKAYITQFDQQLNQYLDETFNRLENQTIEANEFFSNLSMDIISIMLFGKALKQEISIVNRCLADILKIIAYLTVPGYEKLLSIPFPHHNRYHKAVKDLHQLMEELIQGRKKESNQGQGTIDLLLQAGVEPEEIKNQIAVLFFAGHETTATTLTWLLYAVLKYNPLNQEFFDQLELANKRDLKFTEMDQVPYIKALIYETYRCYPAVWNVGRQVLNPIDILGVSLKAGDYLTLSPYVMHRSKQVYENPHRFNINRWIDQNQQFIGPSEKLYFFPYSLGTRNCIGSILAEAEIYSVLKKLFTFFDCRLITKTEIKPKGFITLRPSGKMMVELKKK
jgi:cytochrome P450